jgi:hypothetical protein
MLVGYARVSTPDQHFDLQRDALTHAGCERLFEEKKSGRASTKRPEFEAALAYPRPTDVLVVWKLDRLGRSLVEMMRTIDALRVGGFRSFNAARSAASMPRCGGARASALPAHGPSASRTDCSGSASSFTRLRLATDPGRVTSMAAERGHWR